MSRPDTAGVIPPDSAARLKPDSIARPKGDSLPRPDSLKPTAGAAAAPSPPADSALATACGGGPAGATGVAPGLLLVVFDPAAKPAERAAVAQTVHGKLVGPSGSETVYYLHVPDAESDDQLRTLADQVIRLPGVQQVGTKSCPAANQRSGTPPTRTPS